MLEASSSPSMNSARRAGTLSSCATLRTRLGDNMTSHRTLASALLVAFGALPMRAVAAATPVVARHHREEATVTALSVVSAERSADVVIKVSGSITFNHFTLSKPDKIVVDVNGATLGLPSGEAYDGVARGSIRGIRYSQFTKTVVRVVITLDAAHPYGVLQENGELKVSIDG